MASNQHVKLLLKVHNICGCRYNVVAIKSKAMLLTTTCCCRLALACLLGKMGINAVCGNDQSLLWKFSWHHNIISSTQQNTL